LEALQPPQPMPSLNVQSGFYFIAKKTSDSANALVGHFILGWGLSINAPLLDPHPFQLIGPQMPLISPD
jgi:hypothetical protein